MEERPSRIGVRSHRLVVFLLVASVVVLATEARAETVEKPSLTLGDLWTYRTNSSLAAGFDLQGTVTSSVQGRETHTIQGTYVDAFRVVLSGSGTASGQVQGPLGSGKVNGTWIVTGEELLETGQLKLVSSVLGLSVNGTFQGFVPFSVRAQNTTTYRVVEDGWEYPLTVGGNGSVELAYVYAQDFYAFGNQSHENGAGNLTLTYAMDAAVAVDVPAGVFTAYPVREIWPDGSYDRAYYSPAVGNHVKTESYNETGILTSTTVLLSYRYQAAEPSTYLGLTLIQWAIIVPVVAGTAVLSVVFWRRTRKKRVLPPSMQEPPIPPT